MPRLLKVAVMNGFVFLILLFPFQDFSFASHIGMGGILTVNESNSQRRAGEASWYEGAATVCGPSAIFVFF